MGLCEISMNAKRFVSSTSCLCHANGVMVPNTGVYVIKIRCDSRNEFSLDGIGVCLHDVDLSEEWYCGSKYFMFGDYSQIGNSINSNQNNPFHMKCKWIGDALPECNSGAVLEMIYNSYKGEMKFKKNGEFLGRSIHNLHSVGDLYWCVAVDPCWKCVHDVTIVDYD